MEDGHGSSSSTTTTATTIDAATEGEEERKKRRKMSFVGSISCIFMQADPLDWVLIVFGVIGSIGDGFSTPLMFFLASKLLNDVGGSSSSSSEAFSRNVNKNAVALLYLACGQWVASFIEGYCWTRTSERQARRMATRYFKAVMRQDVEYFDMQVSSIAEVVTTLSNDNLLIQEVLSEKIPNFLMNVTNFLGFYLVGFLVLWRLVIVGLPFVVFLVIPGLIYGRTLMKLARKARDEYNKASNIAAQAITSIRTVYAFVGERKTASAYSAALELPLKLGLRQGLAKGIALGSNGIVFAIWSFLCYYGSRLVMYHHVEGGTVFVVGAGIVIGGVSFGSALSNLKYISEAQSAGERIMEVTRRVPKIDLESTEGEIIDNVRGQVEFKHVKFAYPTRSESLIYEDFNLQIEAGQTVALVGRSGSGKSTAIALLQRFYDPLGGEILLDGVATGKLQLKWLRSQMGLVSQEPALFATTIKENILFGKEDATMEEVIDASKASNAHNFISQLPQGYDTQVGEGGVQMSGGQKQRIAIARAIIRAPRILLLDEATSALDSESEQVVQEALDKASMGCTTIIVSHRLSTIRNADLIAVMQNGKVMELGSHDDLINVNDGIYASLVSLQTRDIDTCHEDNGADDRLLSVTRSMSAVSRSSSISSTQWHPTSAGGKDLQDEEQKLPVPSFRRLLALNLPEMKQMLLGCLGAILFGGVHPVYSYTMGAMVSTFFNKDHDEIKKKTRVYSLAFLGLAFCSLLFNVIQHYNFGYMGEHLTKRVRERMFSKVLTFEVGWFDQEENSSGAILSRLAKDANVVKNLVGDRMSLLVQTISAVIIACTMGLIIAWRLAIVMIAVQPLIIGCIYTQRVLLRSVSKKAIKAQGESSKVALESVSNLRTITAFSSQNRILRMLEASQEGPRKEIARQSVYAGIGLGISNSLLTCAIVLSFWYGSKLIRHGYISGKDLFETYMILISTGRVIADAGSITSDLAKGSDTVGSIFAILDRYSTIEPDDAEGYEPERITGQVVLRNVDFAYPSRPDVMVFKSLSIGIEARKSTALVGPSGSGKSTIIALIERFYDPISGTIRIDGRDIRSYNLRSLRKHIALVSQEPVLFTGSIRDNIAYGAPDGTTMTEIIEAARLANAHDFISGLREGYDTLCGDRGTQLSGGQKQRIAIARAMLKNPGMLLLDEATSALDNQSESLVQDALERVMVGRTSVVVAHRLSTIRNCDLIVVLDKGKVVEKGSHSFLLGKGTTGAYHSLLSLQGASHL